MAKGRPETALVFVGPNADRRADEGPWVRSSHYDLCSSIARCRDQLFEALLVALKTTELEGSVLKSADWLETAAVTCELWVPVGSQRTTRRCKAVVEIRPRPHRNCSLEIVGTFDAGGRSRKGNSWLFDSPERALDWNLLAVETVAAMADVSRPTPELFVWRFSRLFNDIGRKPDRVRAFAEDQSGGAFLVIMLLGIIPTIGPVLILMGMLFMGARHLSKLGDTSVRVVDAGRLDTLPRNLRFVDTWHAVLPGLGGRASEVLQVLTQAEDDVGRPAGARSTTERIWHLGIDGIETREQIVHIFGRAIVFIQVTPYGDDLYVGWDSHLNRGYWKEDYMAEGRDDNGKRVRVTRTVVGEAALSNFDLADVNTLAENIHRSLVREVRRLVAENRIDQEFDFEVNRGRRQDLLQGGGSSGTAPRIRRVG